MSEMQADSQTRNINLPPDPFAAAYPPEGEDFGRYRNLRAVGQGGMATVYRAFDPQLNLDVALKILPRGLNLTPEKKQRFRQEVQLLAAINLPGVIRIFDCGTAQGWEYFSMELVDGPNLAEYARSRELSMTDKLELLERLASVLAALHERDITHRDLKPGNILLTPEGELRLSDFGIAKCFAPDTRLDLTQENARHGTPCYLSPDLPSALQNLEVAKKADVYSLAVVAYELLADSLPYEVENLTPDECFVVIREEPPVDIAEAVPDLPEEYSRPIMQALSKEPTARPAAAAFAKALAGNPDGKPESGRRTILVPIIIIVLSALILMGCLFYYLHVHRLQTNATDAAGSTSVRRENFRPEFACAGEYLFERSV